MNKNNVFELNNDYYNDFLQGEYGIHFFSDDDVQTITDNIIELKNGWANDKSEHITLKSIIDYITSDIKTLNEEQKQDLEDGYDIEVLEELDLKQLDWTKVCEYFGLKFGTVGYSNWSYYVALENAEESFIRDVFEGWNFYAIIQYDDKNEVMDSLCQIYIKNTADIVDAIKDNFDYTGDIKLVNNDDIEYITGLKDIKKDYNVTVVQKKVKEIISFIE